RNAYHFAEFFTTFDIEPPSLQGPACEKMDALLWGHCHHRATGGIDPEHKLLEQMGVSVSPLTGGCCGLAGSWGFEKGKYEISLDCGEQALLPAVRAAGNDTVIVADGFSCKTQIEQAGTGRGALHVAQVMKLAREIGLDGNRPPELAVEGLRPSAGVARRAARIGIPAAAALGVTAALVTRWLTHR
ncbi:MAG: FAD-binding oxidoreductase, partial [Pseudonocardiaceae bacterium]